MKLADGRNEQLLPAGTRIKSTHFPELTGRVSEIEMNAPGVASAIPYRIEWDDFDLAFKRLGWMAIYADTCQIEAA